MANLLKGINRVVTPENKIADAPVVPPAPDPNAPPAPEPPLPGSGRSIGEIAAEVKKKADIAAAAPPVVDPPAAPVVDPPVVPQVPPVVPPAPRLRKKPDVVPPVVPAPAAPVVVAPPVVPVPPAPTPSAEEEYIKGLPQDAQEEIQMAKFGETKFPELKGKASEVVGYFKKMDAFVTGHPDVKPGSDEFKEFIEENRPKWKSGEKRKIETAYITEQTAKAVREEVMRELKPELEATKKRVRDQEVAPLINRAVNEFQDLLVSEESRPDPTMEMIPTEISKLYREKGAQAVAEEYPLEGRIYSSTVNAAQEWMNLANGVTTFNPANSMHKWLLDFVENQGNIWKQNPESGRDGKAFLPLMQYMDLVARDRNEATKYYTFTDPDVLNLLAHNAVINLNSQLKELEKSGFKREKKTAVQSTPPPAPVVPPAPAPVTPPPAAPVAASPRVRSAAAPAPGTTDKPPSAAHSLIERMAPGSASRLGI